MSDFMNQIKEDIQEYQEKYPNIPNIEKPEWAFNFWVLDKLYSEDEDIIIDHIVDYNDKGIDCFVWHEDQLDLYLIQNKYYEDGTRISKDYVTNDFLTRAVTALSNGTYTRSEELQRIFTRFSGLDGFAINMVLYVTNNNCKTEEINNAIENFNAFHKNQNAIIYELDDIKELYYKEPVTDSKSMSFSIQTMNRGTKLDVNNEAYKLTQALNAKYIMTPVTNLYAMYQKAQKEKYPIFDENIREYLGSAGNVNKKIRETLKDPKDRINFFYYNNGITIIVRKLSDGGIRNQMRIIDIEDPQIVNGCQTVSTINEVFSGWPAQTLEEDFKNTFVMLKVLEIPDDSPEKLELKKNIVTYNNSQNSIEQKTFEASAEEFKRLQVEFRRKGLLICIKQSDKYRYTKVEFKSAADLMGLNGPLMERFGLKSLNKTSAFLVNLEKLLQIITAFIGTPMSATQNKSKLLKTGSEVNKNATDFIKRDDVTINSLVLMYMLYLRGDYEKRSNDGRMPNPLYLVHCVGRYECNGDPTKLKDVLCNEVAVNRILTLYTSAFTGYYNGWKLANPGKEYNDMIKNPIDYTIMNQSRDMAKSMLPKLT